MPFDYVSELMYMPAVVMRSGISGDANYDGKVDINDLTIVLAHYGQTGIDWSQGDFNGRRQGGHQRPDRRAAHYGQTAGGAVSLARCRGRAGAFGPAALRRRWSAAWCSPGDDCGKGDPNEALGGQSGGIVMLSFCLSPICRRRGYQLGGPDNYYNADGLICTYRRTTGTYYAMLPTAPPLPKTGWSGSTRAAAPALTEREPRGVGLLREHQLRLALEETEFVGDGGYARLFCGHVHSQSGARAAPLAIR